MIKHILVLLVAVQISVASFAFATPSTIYFGDAAKYWPGYDPHGDTQNSGDVIGDPNILGGTMTLDNGKISSIRFNYNSPYNDWQMLAPGNLFINVLNSSDDNTWDYVINTKGDPTKNSNTAAGKAGTNVTLAAGDYNIYSITNAGFTSGNVFDPRYVLSGQDGMGVWVGYGIRDNHPIAINSNYLGSALGTVYFTGFGGNTGTGSFNNTTLPYYTGSSMYTFDNLDLLPSLYGKSIIIGWEMTCANDVLYEKVTIPTPEPSTFILLGAGLLIAGFARRKVRK